MTAPDIIKAIMNCSHPHVTIEVLAKLSGYKTPSGVSERLRGKDMTTRNLFKFADALGYEIVVQPKTAKPLKEDCYRIEYDLGGEGK